MSRRRFLLPLIFVAACTVSEPVITAGGAGGLRVIPPVEPLDALTLRVPMGLVGGSGTALWTSSDSQVATVDAAGNLTTVNNGKVTISAVRGGLSGSLDLTVRQRATTITVTPSQLSFGGIGESRSLTIQAQDRKSQPVAAAALSFSSTDPRVVEVSAAGVVTAIGVGKAAVVVESGEVGQPVAVDVTAGTGQAEVVVDPS